MTSEAFLLVHSHAAAADVLLTRLDDRLASFTRFSAGRFTLFAADPSRLIVVPPAGFLIGRIFRRRGAPRAVRRFDDAELEALSTRPADTLARDFWGNYVFASDDLVDPAILRAPLGHLPCFVWRDGPNHVAAGDLATMQASGLVTLRIDWAGVGRALLRPDLPHPATALEAITEVLPGVRRSWADGDDRDQAFWSPWDHVDGRVAGEPLAERLGREVRNVTAALTDGFEHVLVGASGGLDSSVLACCLAARPGRSTLLTMATATPDGDERRFARAVAAGTGLPLIERFYDAGLIDLDTAISAHLPRPTGWIHEGAYTRAVRDEAASVAAHAFVSGNGGDNSFYNTMSARPLVDSLIARRPLRASARTAADIAALTGASFAAIARETGRTWQARGRPYRWQDASDLLARDLVACAETTRPAHPWLEERFALPGKIGHIAMLLRIQNHLSGFDPAWRLPVVNPLATQPIVELCLGVPSWEWIRGGIDRRPVREAFDAELPRLVARRVSKGTPNAVVLALLQSRAAEIRERLLDGALSRYGVVDRIRLEQQLTGEPAADQPDPLTLMALLNAEAWVRRWT